MAVNLWRAASRLAFAASVLWLFMALTGCVAFDYAQSPARIGLLAPFEGRYREIGYDALYAARLALAEADADYIELLAVDDGGTVATAIARARALADDPQVKAVIVLGYAATDAETLAAFADLPVIVVGEWGVDIIDAGHYILASPAIRAMLTVDARIAMTEAAQVEAPVVGGTVFGLAHYPALRSDLTGVRVVSSGTLPDATFTARILAANPFAEPPGLLATTVYDAAGMLVSALDDGRISREVLRTNLASMRYLGISDEIGFVDGYWQDAPVNLYEYNAAQKLAPINGE